MTSTGSRAPARHAPAGGRLDPRQPLVLDTRELGRRAGSMTRVRRTVPAPAHLGSGLAKIAEGSDVQLDLRLEAVMEGVLVSGTATATMTGECGRCLDPLSEDITVDLQELYSYADSRSTRERGRGAPAAGAEGEEEDDVLLVVEDLIDLEPLVRDALVLSLPLSPVCDEDCAGLCAGCGGRLDDLEPGHTHEAADPRWAALANLHLNPEEN